MRRRASVLSVLSTSRRKGSRVLGTGSVLALALVLLAACTGVTVLHAGPTVGQYNVEVRVDPPNLQDGQKATLNYLFTNSQNGKQVVNLPLVNDATVYATVVNRDMTWFRTGKAVGPINGAYPVNLRFGPPDSYRLYTELTSAYTPTEHLLYTQTLSFGANAPSLEQPAALQESPSPRSNSFFGVVVSLDTGGALRVKQPARFHYTLSLARDGAPVRDVAPLDGAAGHLFVISADGEEFTHALAQEAIPGAGNAQNEPTQGGSSGTQSGNPVAPGTTPAPTVEGTPGATPSAEAGQAGLASIGPDLTFDVEFEKPGLHKTWLEFLYHGQPVTADYVVNVAP